MTARGISGEGTTEGDPDQPGQGIRRSELPIEGWGLFEIEWSEGGLTAVALPGLRLPPLAEGQETEPLPAAFREPLLAYFAGDPIEPTELPVVIEGDSFQARAWRHIRGIPRGAVRTYGSLSKEIGEPRGAQAFGAAMRCNPLPIVVPCHRVVAAGFHLHGFAGGLELKERLLRLEGVAVKDGRAMPGQLGLF